jgi:hypothetical protein
MMPMKKALIVGMNVYPNPRNNLPSCVDDANAFRRLLLTRYDFPAEQIETYFNEASTLAAIRERLFNWLFKDTAQDDRLVFYFSGHGWRTEREGVLRECLCLYDDFLFDDELVGKSQGLPMGSLTVVLDSCHSGGLSKPFFVEQQGQELTENKVWRPDGDQQDSVVLAEKAITPIKPFGRAPVTLAAPPLEAAKTFQTERLLQDAVLAQESDPELYPALEAGDAGEPELNGLLISASKAEEPAAASTSATTSPDGKEKLSAFTFALRRSFDALIETERSVERISSRQLLDATAGELKRLGFKQTPLLQETTRSTGLGSHTFVSLQPIGTGASVPAAGSTIGVATMPDWQSPDFQRLIDELVRALVSGNGAGSTALGETSRRVS